MGTALRVIITSEEKMCQSEISPPIDEISGQVSNAQGITDNAIKAIRDIAEAIFIIQQVSAGMLAVIEQQAAA